MQKDPFVTLGVSSDVTQNELYDAYRRLRDVYLDKRFAPGDEGMRACEKLDEIDGAYREAERILQSRYYVSNTGGSSYEGIEQFIKEKKFFEAQEALDKVQSRDAEWHYLQAMVYYSKRWFNEAREQLKSAINMDPTNSKYAEALRRLEDKLNGPQNPNPSHNNFYTGGNGDRSYRDTSADRGTRRGFTACDCCSSLICADCCCECMGGDLIACC